MRCCWLIVFFFFWSVTFATELFAWMRDCSNNNNNKYLGQQQSRIYHFYAFCIKNKFNNCFVLGCKWLRVHTWPLICDMHTQTHARRMRFNFRMSSARLSLARALRSRHTSPHSLPAGSAFAFVSLVATNYDDSVLGFEVAAECSPHGQKSHFKYFISIFAIRP